MVYFGFLTVNAAWNLDADVRCFGANNKQVAAWSLQRESMITILGRFVFISHTDFSPLANDKNNDR